MASSKEQQQQKLAVDISKTHNVIRKKHLALRLGKREVDREINKQAEQIFEPLNQFINQVQRKVKENKGMAYVKWLGIEGPTWISIKNISQ